MDSEFAPAYAKVGAISFQQSEWTDAIDYYRTYAKLKPGSVKVHQMLGSVALQLNDFSTAKEAFEQVVATDPKDAFPYYGLGLACLGLSLMSEGESHLHRALEAQPDHPEYLERQSAIGDKLAVRSR